MDKERKEILPLNWQKDLIKNKGVDIESIDDDLLMFDNINRKMLPAFSYPFKLDVTVCIIVTKGWVSGKIGIKSVKTTPSCIIVTPVGEIMQYEHISDDFSGLFMVMSKQLSSNILPNIQERLPVELSLRKNPYVPLNDKELDMFKTHYEILKKVVGMKENPYRKEIVQLLLRAFYYQSDSLQYKNLPKGTQSKHEEYVEQFWELVQKNYKTERQIGFYADKMCLTPKYLSKIIRTNTGKSANSWIDEYVILEAKALLKSTNLTVQQISDELNFVDQSIFGKYFKRREGVSPKEYKGEMKRNRKK